MRAARPSSGRSPALLGLAIVLAIVGGAVGLQGLGVPIGSSFMIGDLRWTAIGIVLLAVAAAIAWWRLRAR